eukprot:gnl/MRDRNA2_/MRDRNA2_70834_c0_seq1.p1 gnl/MRDRNA2_/MRDRNA2_70834_c0~~gnl/MRDRNA2_/MRDRNA2_70834_c0_seq1.p1  ORF type:complete len:149 (-),score=14.41 gnl/MRDRNA2_/MRDRNA2_70834_c0_seq1:35-481(-)
MAFPFVSIVVILAMLGQILVRRRDCMLTRVYRQHLNASVCIESSRHIGCSSTLPNVTANLSGKRCGDESIWAQAIEKSSDCNLFQGIVIGGYLLEFVHGLGPFNSAVAKATHGANAKYIKLVAPAMLVVGHLGELAIHTKRAGAAGHH